jgi:hypothetical protein
VTLSPRLLVLDGDLNLTGDNTDPSGLAFRIDTLGPGTTWGNPEGITRMVSSWLADGSIVTHDRDDNRTLSIPVRVTAATSAALQAGEAALFHRCNRSTTLTWTPPWDTAAPIASIFEVWSGALEGDLQSNGGDLNELHLTRFYTLTLTAKPYTRSQALVEFAALTKPATESTVQIDNCAATTGWAGSPNAVATTGVAVTETVVTEVSSRLGGGRQAGGATYHLSLTRTGSVDMTGFPYLRVTFSMPGISWDPKVHADGVLLTQVASSGRVRWFKAPASFTTLKVGGSFYTNRELTVVLSVWDVTQTNVAGVVNTVKELARTVWVEGSARTGGSIAVEHGTDGLGQTLVYTCPASPAGYVPAMSSYWTAGPSRAADTTAVSGQKTLVDHTSINGAGGVLPTFTIPGDQVMEADYGVMVRVKANTPADYAFQVIAYVDGHSLVVEEAEITPVISPADTGYHLYWLGRMTLPPLAIPVTSSQNVVVTIQAYNPTSPFTATDPVYLDELWLFNLTDGALSIVAAGSSQRVWLDSADGERPNPTIWLGSDVDRGDAVAAPLLGTVKAMGSHELLPGYMDLFTVTTGADNADASVTYYPRWHTHAAL